MDSGYPQDISRWGGVPRNIDAVLTSVFDGLTYFFKGDEFWTFDDYSLSTAPDSPRRINGFWTFTSCSDEWDANLKKIRWYYEYITFTLHAIATWCFANWVKNMLKFSCGLLHFSTFTIFRVELSPFRSAKTTKFSHGFDFSNLLFRSF